MASQQYNNIIYETRSITRTAHYTRVISRISSERSPHFQTIHDASTIQIEPVDSRRRQRPASRIGATLEPAYNPLELELASRDSSRQCLRRDKEKRTLLDFVKFFFLRLYNVATRRDASRLWPLLYKKKEKKIGVPLSAHARPY